MPTSPGCATWPGRLVVKGIQDVEDARRWWSTLGVDGVVVSNHGGRQLDRAPAPLEVLPAMVDAVGGRTEVLSTPGSWTAPTSSRPWLRGPGLPRRPGVPVRADGGWGAWCRPSTEILRDQVTRTMRLLGVTSLDELTPAHAIIRRRDPQADVATP